MESNLIKVSPTTAHWQRDSEIEEFRKRESDRVKSEIIDQLPVAERLKKQREQVSKLEAEIAAKEAAELKKLDRANHLDQMGRNLAKELERGGYIASQAESAANGDTLALCLSGNHPNPRYNDSFYWGACEIANLELAAKRIVEFYPEWRKSRVEALEAVKTEITALATELKFNLPDWAK
jgi:hypothetical protein